MDKCKLIICDIDGTLVNEARELTDFTKKTIEKIHEQGIKFGVASGREVTELKYFTDKWKLSFPLDIIIGLNGGQLWDGASNHLYEFDKLHKEWIKEILDILRPFDLNPYIVENGIMLCKRMDWLVEKSSKRSGSKVVIAKNESDFYNKEHAKIMFKVPEDKIDEIMAYAKDRIGDGYVAFKTQPIMLEFCNKYTNKGNALIEYTKLNNMKMEDIIAFGDMSNDNEMLKVAGLGVCLKNGSEDTKRCANVITEYTNDEDGFARFLIDNGYL